MNEAEDAADFLAALTTAGAVDALEAVAQLEGSTIVFEIAFCFGDRQPADQKPLVLALGAGPFRLDRIVLAQGLTVVEMDGANDPLTGRAGALLFQLDGASWAGARFVGRFSWHQGEWGTPERPFLRVPAQFPTVVTGDPYLGKLPRFRLTVEPSAAKRFCSGTVEGSFWPRSLVNVSMLDAAFATDDRITEYDAQADPVVFTSRVIATSTTEERTEFSAFVTRVRDIVEGFFGIELSTKLHAATENELSGWQKDTSYFLQFEPVSGPIHVSAKVAELYFRISQIWWRNGVNITGAHRDVVLKAVSLATMLRFQQTREDEPINTDGIIAGSLLTASAGSRPKSIDDMELAMSLFMALRDSEQIASEFRDLTKRWWRTSVPAREFLEWCEHRGINIPAGLRAGPRQADPSG